MKRLALALALSLLLIVMACSAQKSTENGSDNVSVNTPVGEFNAESSNDIETSATGLPVYPGAQPEGSDSGAKTRLSAPFVGIEIKAVKFTTTDPPDRVLTFYRTALSRYGNVKEDHDVDSKLKMGNFSWNSSGNQTALTTDEKNGTHLVVVKPKDNGTEFLLFALQARGPKETM
jgi:hypothetical protein